RAGEALKELVRRSILPVVADIHFDYRLALMALDAKVNKLRLTRGIIHNKDGVREVVKRAREQGTPIRIGVNHGSIGDRQPGDIRDESQRMVDLALSEIRILEDLDFDNIVVSVKAFEVPVMIAAYRRLAKAVPYPLHLGVTEAGTALSGSIRSAAGMSVLLYEGIGDTIRVSLSEDPVVEVKAAFDLLKSLGLRDQGLTLVACPSCGRADIDLIPLAKVAEERLRAMPTPMKVAVMGCEVNGPGEAKDADVGIAGRWAARRGRRRLRSPERRALGSARRDEQRALRDPHRARRALSAPAAARASRSDARDAHPDHEVGRVVGALAGRAAGALRRT